MKLAILADIHANREALDACLAHAGQQGVQNHVFLGDLVGYGADPHACLDRIRHLAAQGAWVLRGNHDDAALDGLCADMHPEAREAALWTRQRLDVDERDFLRALPLEVRLGDCLLVHASAARPPDWEYITGEQSAARCFAATDARVICAGHVHRPMLCFSTRGGVGSFIPRPGVALPLIAGRRWLLVAPSVGQPRDGHPATGYLLLDLAHRKVTYFRLPYDWMRAAARIRAAGLPETLADRLEHGL